MPKNDFIFVDESGDPGYEIHPESGKLLGSEYYVAATLHVCDDSIRFIHEHVAAFRYLTRLSKELKIPPGQPNFDSLMEPIGTLAREGHNIWASVVYLDKRTYTGSYLKPGGRHPTNAVQFRNYIIRRLLEFHFKHYPLASKQYDLVLDRIEMTKEQNENLQSYLAGNYNIPTPTNITHASSIYVESLQIVQHIASGYKGVVSGAEPPPGLSFVNERDITTHQYFE